MDFAHFWEYFMTFAHRNPGFKDSKNALKLASFHWYQHCDGLFFHSFFFKEHDFQHRFQNSIIPKNFKEFPGTMDTSLELASFNWYQHCDRLCFHLFFVKKQDFQYRFQNSIIPENFKKFPGTMGTSLELAQSSHLANTL